MQSLLPENSPLECSYSLEELAQLDPSRIPSHVAIIMDGNRRWAKQRGLPPLFGHRQGADTIQKIVRAAADLGIKVLTVYTFSTENWNRSAFEVDGLMDIIKLYLKMNREQMVREGVRLEAIGDLKRLRPDVIDAFDVAQQATRKGDRIEFVLALNYGARDEIRRAVLSLVTDIEEGKLMKDDLSEETLARYLDTARWKDPELLVRTSGEYRLSNFLLWQLSYSEVHVTDVLWPDFSPRDLLNAVLDYQQRKRNWGK